MAILDLQGMQAPATDSVRFGKSGASKNCFNTGGGGHGGGGWSVLSVAIC